MTQLAPLDEPLEEPLLPDDPLPPRAPLPFVQVPFAAVHADSSALAVPK